jgi:hypothetical protein
LFFGCPITNPFSKRKRSSVLTKLPDPQPNIHSRSYEPPL